MERQRRITKGTLSEILGKDALPVDKFSRKVGFERIAKETFLTLNESDK